MSFKKGDIVYCPSLSTCEFYVDTREDCNGLFIRFRGDEYWFNLNGVPTQSSNINRSSARRIPFLFHSSEEMRKSLNAVYDDEFGSNTTIKVYALKIQGQDRFVGMINGSSRIIESEESVYKLKLSGAVITPSICDLEILKEKTFPNLPKEIVLVGYLNTNQL